MFPQHLKSKLLSGEDDLQRKLAIWRLKGYRVVFTNGCFDILHPGHIHTLVAAAEQGDALVVGLNSDDSVKRLKGNDRPVMPESDRALMLATLHMVDAVVVFDEDTPEKLIKEIKPDVLVKGGDYAIDTIVGAQFVKASGGKVVTVPLVEGKATTSIIEKIKQT